MNYQWKPVSRIISALGQRSRRPRLPNRSLFGTILNYNQPATHRNYCFVHKDRSTIWHKLLQPTMQSQTETPDEALERIKAIAASIFDIDPMAVDLLMGPDDIDRWDSLNHLRLITDFEKSFDMRLTMQQIQQIASLRDLASLVPQHHP